MIQQTSLDAWTNLQESGHLSSCQKIIYDVFVNNDPMPLSNTDVLNILNKERLLMGKKLWGINQITPRVLELRSFGKIVKAGEKIDLYSNRRVLAWALPETIANYNHYGGVVNDGRTMGPTGSGKTMLLQLMAEFWGGTYDYQSLNGSITIHDLTQERILDKKGQFIERDMCLATWLRNSQKEVSILHLDEINAARPETLLALHPIMDLKGCLVLPYSEEVLKANKNSILVMSANEGDEYQGINGLNMAFQNRLVKIHLPYIQGEKLIARLVQGTGIVREKAQMVVNTWTKYMESRDSEQPGPRRNSSGIILFFVFVAEKFFGHPPENYFLSHKKILLLCVVRNYVY